MGFYFDGSGQRTHRQADDELEPEEMESLRPSPGKSSRTHGGGDALGIPGKISLTARLAQRIDRYARAGRHVTPDDHARALVAQALGSAGKPLPENLRRSLEDRASTSLSDIRIHTGPDSARAAEALGAEAYTVDRDIHFAAGQYNPDSASGQRLIAHEVTHAVQQRGLPRASIEHAAISQPDQAHERHADEFAGLFERSDETSALPDETRASMERAFGSAMDGRRPATTSLAARSASPSRARLSAPRSPVLPLCWITWASSWPISQSPSSVPGA